MARLPVRCLSVVVCAALAACARPPADDARLEVMKALEQQPPAVEVCRIFGAATTPAQEVRFFAVDLQGQSTVLLGPALSGATVAGVAIHPLSGVLYALLSDPRGGGSYLATIDRATGDVARVGPTGLDRVGGLAVRPTDGALFTWAQGRGPAVVDTSTGAATQVASSPAPVTDLAWGPQGRVLYAAGERQLYAWDAVASRVVERTRLPVGMGGLLMRADGQLVLTGPAPETGTAIPEPPPGLARPFSLLVLDPATGTSSATFSAEPVQVDPARPLPDLAATRVESLTWAVNCGNPSPGGPADLIDGVTVLPGAVCPGEPVQVVVEARHPEGAANPVVVSIDGLPGTSRWLQYDGAPGTRLVTIAATTAEGYVDRASATVEVSDCGAMDPWPAVRVRSDPYRANMADLEVVNAAAVAPPGSRFRWEFGDGSPPEEGTVPFVRHAYGASLPRDVEYPSFDAAVTLIRPDATEIRIPRTVTLRNAYAADRRRGLVRPPVILAPPPPVVTQALAGTRSIVPATATFTVRNVEDAPILLASAQVEHHPCDPDVSPIAFDREPLAVTIAPGATWEHTFPLPSGEGICGAAVHVAGSAGILRRVAVDVYVETRRNPYDVKRVSDANTLAALQSAVAQGLVPERGTDEERLFQLSRELRIPRPGDGEHVPPPPPAEADPVVGTRCEPGDTPPHGGVTCQATEEWEVAPPHIRNALKGDVVIGAACGFVGDLLRSVNPPQTYSHSGIMTRNHYEIVHSTAASERYPDYPAGGGSLTEGIEEEVLKYGWPGIIRQPIGDAFRTVPVIDPGGFRYELHGFSQNPTLCPQDQVITVPKVIRPPPDQAASVRPALEAAADLAAASSATLSEVMSGVRAGHYRLYAYTDTRIALQPEYDWSGPATMCSGFVWRSLKLAGLQLEGPELENEDWNAGARVNLPDLPDGLYAYDESERYNAGRFIHDFLYDTAYTEAGWFGNALTDAADDLANQFTNCFASDRCNTAAKDSEAWQGEAGVGRAVSPEDMLFWDPPLTGGAYGSDEPLVYRSGDYVRKYVWGRAENAGDVRGVVTFRGAPMQGARVVLYADTTRETVSLSDGSFKFLAVPAPADPDGPGYEIRAEKYELDIKLEEATWVNVPAGGTAQVEIQLHVPPAYLRRLVFQGSGSVLDTEFDGDVTYPQSFFAACSVDPFAPEAWTDPDPWDSGCVGGEIVVRVWIQCLLAQDRQSVHYTVTAKLWEGTDCSTPVEDLADTDYPSGVVAADGVAAFGIHLLNTEWDSPDAADFDLAVVNQPQ